MRNKWYLKTNDFYKSPYVSGIYCKELIDILYMCDHINHYNCSNVLVYLDILEYANKQEDGGVVFYGDGTVRSLNESNNKGYDVYYYC